LRPKAWSATPKTFDFKVIRLQLALAGKGLRRIAGQFLHPTAQHVLVQIEIPRRLGHAHAAFAHQTNRFNFELPTE